MPYMQFNIRRIRLLFLCACILFCLTGCSASPLGSNPSTAAETEQAADERPDGPPRDSTPRVLTPKAPGTAVLAGEHVSLDVSNASDGYLILTYTGTNEKVKFQMEAPNGVTYTYLVTASSSETIFPLTGGAGTYSFSLLESVDAEKDLYAIAFAETVNVPAVDDFLPYLTPNVYIYYEEGSAAVAQGAQLAENCYSDLEVIENIYYYVTQNITYDESKAQSVAYGYIPDPDTTLASGTGICFDYASLMTAMLRSQQIPTRLEVGYAGEIYHAWISCYVDEIGWVDNIIEFDGKSWSLMDPTLAANNSSTAVQKYIGDGSKYVVKYTY